MAAAQDAGLAIKVNVVALKGVNEDELGDWCGGVVTTAMTWTIIEVMPMGDIGNETRVDQYLPVSVVRSRLAQDSPSQIALISRLGQRAMSRSKRLQRLGFITPMTHNFCESCNRVRMTCTGQLYMCLGQDDNASLSTALRAGGVPALKAAIIEAIARKPKGHDFMISRRQTSAPVGRHMNVTGG